MKVKGVKGVKGCVHVKGWSEPSRAHLNGYTERPTAAAQQRRRKRRAVRAPDWPSVRSN